MNSERRVVITGMGIMCSLGNDKDEVLKNLINESKPFVNSEDLDGVKVGKCGFSSTELNTPDSFERIELMTFKTIEQAMEDSRITIDMFKEKKYRAALSIANSMYGIDYWLKGLDNEVQSGQYYLNSRQLVSRLTKKYGIKGSTYMTNTACASGTSAIALGYDLIKNNEADIVLVGGTDTISKFTLFGFKALQSLSKNICKPFDQERDGINIGEGSSFFILEDLEHAKERGIECYAEIMGYGLCNEAYHMTSPDPEGTGAHFVMKEAIKQAGIKPEDIDYINAHGTGTMANDKMEIKAIEDLFENQNNISTFVSSTKSRTGHCLGAAGSIELGLSLLAMNSNIYLSTLNSNVNIEDKLGLLEIKNKNKEINYVMSNSFAFAGNMASVVIKKYKNKKRN